MALKVSKVTKRVPVGAAGSTIVQLIVEGLREAEAQVRREGGVLLPEGQVLLVIEQNFDDMNGR